LTCGSTGTSGLLARPPLLRCTLEVSKPEATATAGWRRATNINAGANMAPQSPARGGATAGLAGNPARGGNPVLKGTGPSSVPNGHPDLLSPQQVMHHNLKAGQARGLLKAGHSEAQGFLDFHNGKLDRHAAAKRSMAAKASVVKAPRGGLGKLGGVQLPPAQGTLMSQGNESDVPSGSAIGTTRSPLQQNTSGGRSQVPNANSGFGRRGGPGSDFDY
jgi:hypothetical protein